ncbi:MAG: hypothetical protein KBT68_01880 [bacterium]|nr:hypothetical protein [Candidatus Colisoma equi]
MFAMFLVVAAALTVQAAPEVRPVRGLGDVPGENVRAIQAAIDGCAAKGGGRVEVPAGTWICGTIRLRSGVDLHLEKGAVLQASPDLADYNGEGEYPENFACPSEGWSARHFIIAYRVVGASITGEGMVDGNADAFFEGLPRLSSRAKIVWANGTRRMKDMRPGFLRPGPLIVFVKSRDVLVEGITVRQSPCWSLLFHGCDNVTVRDYRVRNGSSDLNTDGMDIDCCSNVLVERADIRTGDDAIAIRASMDPLGLEKPCEHIRIRDCDLSAYAMGVRIGVGNGVIRGVDIENIRIRHAAWGVSFDCWYGARDRAGVDIEDVRIGKSRFDGCYEGWRFRLGGEKQLFGVRRIRFEDCVFTSPLPGTVAYCGDKPLSDVSFRNCTWSPATDNPFNSVVHGKDLEVQ